MSASFRAYIDESGDEGFSFGPNRSSQWFVLSAVITETATDRDVLALVDGVRQTLNKPPRKVLHFRDLRHEQRLPLCQRDGAGPASGCSCRHT